MQYYYGLKIPYYYGLKIPYAEILSSEKDP